MRAFGTLAGATVAIAFISGLTGVISTRALGPYQRGLMATAVVWSSLVATFVGVAFTESTTHFVAREADRRALFASSALVASATAGVLLAALGVLVSIALGGPARLPLAIIFTATLAWLISGAGIGAILGQGEFRAASLMRLLIPVAMLGGVVLVVSVGWRTAVAISTVTTCAAWLQAALVLRSMRRRRLLARPSRAAAKKIVSYGWRSIVHATMWMMSYKLDQLVLSIAVAPALLGLYAVAASFGELIAPLAASTGQVMLTRVSTGGVGEVRRSLRPAVGLCVIVASACAVVTFILAPVAVRVLFGPKFEGAVTSLRILLPGAIALATSTVLANTIRGLGRPLTPAGPEFVGVVCTAVLLAVLLPPLGIEGAAIASTISYTVVALGMAVALKLEIGKLSVAA